MCHSQCIGLLLFLICSFFFKNLHFRIFPSVNYIRNKLEAGKNGDLETGGCYWFPGKRWGVLTLRVGCGVEVSTVPHWVLQRQTGSGHPGWEETLTNLVRLDDSEKKTEFFSGRELTYGWASWESHLNHLSLIFLSTKLGWELSSSSVVKTLHFQCRVQKFNPWMRN